MTKTTIEELMELKQLYETGILTKEEMEVEKKKILGTNSESSKETQKIEEPILSKTYKEQKEIFDLSENETVDITDDSFFEKNKISIFGSIAFLLVVTAIIFLPKIMSHSDSGIIIASQKEVVNREIYLKGVINYNIGFSMQLKQNGNDIEGTLHYDSQKSDAIIKIKGTIDNDGTLILNESRLAAIGTFTGIMDVFSYSGFYISSDGEQEDLSFYSKILTKERLDIEKDAIKKIGDKGTIIAEFDDKIYFIDKDYSEARYESEGANCGKLYIYDLNKENTSSERIRIPSGEMYSIVECRFRDMNITFILCDVGRNGFGIENYCTEVSQYNIRTGKWKDIAQGCANADFIDDGKKIKITYAEITNYNEAEAAYDYIYDYTDEIVTL